MNKFIIYFLTKLIHIKIWKFRLYPLIVRDYQKIERKRIRIQHPRSFLRGGSELVIVSGADRRYYLHAHRFLNSVYLHEPNTKTVFYDLGLEQNQLDELVASFPNVDFRTFDYSKYPSYFNIKVATGEYAWKPVIIHDTLNEFKTNIFWLDAGCVITEPLRWVRIILDGFGFYSPISDGDIKKWTHPNMLNYLNVANDLLRVRNLSACIVGFNYRNPKAIEIARRWRECALIKDCIAPVGSNRSNHRQDQAGLSIIARQVGGGGGLKYFTPILSYGVAMHVDYNIMKKRNEKLLAQQ